MTQKSVFGTSEYVPPTSRAELHANYDGFILSIIMLPWIYAVTAMEWMKEQPKS
jgi:hypothetical protein